MTPLVSPRKVPVRLCSITEPIEQQSDRLGSIEFDWFLVRFRSIDYAGMILNSRFQISKIPVQLRTYPLFLRLASIAFPDIGSVGRIGEKKKLKKKLQQVSK